MKLVLSFIFYLSLITNLYSQVADNWVFGYKCGLNFSGANLSFFQSKISDKYCGGFSVISDTMPATRSNSISDCNGKLLFSTNGKCLWNKDGNLMPNYCLSDSNADIRFFDTKILQFPNNDSLYYIFYSIRGLGLRFAILNIKADSGRGNILSTGNYINNHFFVYPAELIQHSNGTDYWLVCKPNATEIFSYLITTLGINLTPIISAAVGPNSHFRQLKASLSGNYLIYFDNTASGSLPTAGYCCNFNRTTGTISNKKLILNTSSFPLNLSSFNGIEFSPNDSFIYTLTMYGLGGNSRVTQFKRYATNPVNTAVEVAYTTSSNMLGIQLAPDGKIYLSNLYSPIISCISRPDFLGSSCNFVYNYINVSPFSLNSGFPNVHFKLRRLNFSSNAFNSTSCISDSVCLNTQGDTTFINYRWYIYNSNDSLLDSTDVKNPVLWLANGTYKIKLRAKNPECNSYTWWTDNIYVNREPKLTLKIDSNGISCSNQFIKIKYTSEYADSLQIDWNDGNVSPWIKSDSVGYFSHTYFDSTHVYRIKLNAKNQLCNSSITLTDTVTLQPKPTAKFFANNTSQTFPISGCAPLTVSLSDSSQFADSTWLVLRNGSGNTILHSLFTINLPDTGWFHITQYVSNHDGCLDSFVVNNAVYVAPAPTLQSSSDSTFGKCVQNNLRLKLVSGYCDSISLNWGDGNSNKIAGNRNGSQSDTLSHVYAGTGWFQVIVSAGNVYCTVADTLMHFVRAPIQTTVSFDTTVCKGAFANLRMKATGADSVFSYLLQTPSSVLFSANGSFWLVPDSSFVYSMGAVNVCAGDTIWEYVVVTVLPGLKLNLNFVDTTVCGGAGVTARVTPTGGNISGYSFALFKNNIIQQTNATGIFNIVVSTNETYTVVLTDGCSTAGDSATFTVKIFNDLKFTQTQPDAYLCSGTATTLKTATNSGSGTVNYQWIDLATNAVLSATDSLTLTPFSSQQIIIKATDACKTISDTIQVYVFATAASTLLAADKASGCVPLTVNFESPLLTYSNNLPCEVRWDFGDGGSLVQTFNSSTPILKATHTFVAIGVYQVKAEVKFKSNTSVCMVFNLSVEALQVPQITISIAPPKITLPKTQCTATITSFFSDSLIIDWGDGSTDMINTNLGINLLTHDYSDTGHYIVKATAYNKNTCYKEAFTNVYHADTFTCFIPNIFTPNKDGLNETFQPVLNFCRSYELIIYDRWGAELFRANTLTSKPQQLAWTGNDAPSGTYLYTLRATDGDGRHYDFKGTVIMVR